MKASELIEKLKGFEDFDLRIVISHEKYGERPQYTEHNLTFEDVGYSENKIIFGTDR